MKTKKTESESNNTELEAMLELTSSDKKVREANTTNKNGKFKLPDLPYVFNALEPYIDSRTMEIHYDKHHAAYVNNLNTALEGMKNVPSLEEIIKNISKYAVTVRNNGGGHYNHSMFWKMMKYGGGGQPSGKLAEAINASFGSFENFKNKFSDEGMKVFGSGWAWLVVNNGKLEIGTTPNQDNPLMDISGFKGSPVLCLDLWEHAYYLKHQNKRIDYIKSWWSVVNWEEVENLFKTAK